jgi:hypothetical protein
VALSALLILNAVAFAGNKLGDKVCGVGVTNVFLKSEYIFPSVDSLRRGQEIQSPVLRHPANTLHDSSMKANVRHRSLRELQ